MATTPTYTLAQSAKRAAATVHQVRTYVTSGLVTPCATTPGGYFLFNDEGVACLRLIAAATRAGLRIADIGALVKALECDDQIAILAARRSVNEAIGTRQLAMRQLRALVTATLRTAPREASA